MDVICTLCILYATNSMGWQTTSMIYNSTNTMSTCLVCSLTLISSQYHPLGKSWNFFLPLYFVSNWASARSDPGDIFSSGTYPRHYRHQTWRFPSVTVTQWIKYCQLYLHSASWCIYELLLYELCMYSVPFHITDIFQNSKGRCLCENVIQKLSEP